MRKSVFLLCLFLVIAPATFAAKIITTDQLIAELQKKYAKSWYKTATFVQKTINIDKDGNRKEEIWFEALSVPGSLRIDFTPTKDGNGILFTNNKIYVFKNGKAASERPFVHPLMVLGFDMYRLPHAEVVERLKGLHFDLSILREDKWQGREVYVVGAKQGDLHSGSSGLIRRTCISCACSARPARMDRRHRKSSSTNTRNWRAAGCHRK